MSEGRFTGRVAVITGGSLGIGRAAGERLVAEGASVVVGGLDEASVADAVEALGERADGVAGDVRSTDCAEALVARAVERFGGLDVLVTSAGVQRYGTVVDTSEETWDEVLDINVKGVFLAARAAVPALRERGGGAIVCVSSAQATASQNAVAAYTASKGAISALVRAMAIDHAPDGIRVNSVAPGSVDTPMLRWAAGLFRGERSVEDMVDAWGRLHPLGRVADAADVAGAIAYLAGDDARFVTGAELRVDGGLTAGLPVELPR